MYIHTCMLCVYVYINIPKGRMVYFTSLTLAAAFLHQVPGEPTILSALLSLLTLLWRKLASALERSRPIKGHVCSDKQQRQRQQKNNTSGSSLSPLHPQHPRT